MSVKALMVLLMMLHKIRRGNEIEYWLHALLMAFNGGKNYQMLLLISYSVSLTEKP